MYYEEIKPDIFEKAKKEIRKELKAGLENKVISTHEYNEMLPDDKTPGKFYQLFKVHKKHSPPSLPPGRPIISGCGSITEKISLFVDHHSKN